MRNDLAAGRLRVSVDKRGWHERQAWRAPKEVALEGRGKVSDPACEHRFTRTGSTCVNCGVKA